MIVKIKSQQKKNFFKKKIAFFRGYDFFFLLLCLIFANRFINNIEPYDAAGETKGKREKNTLSLCLGVGERLEGSKNYLEGKRTVEN